MWQKGNEVQNSTELKIFQWYILVFLKFLGWSEYGNFSVVIFFLWTQSIIILMEYILSIINLFQIILYPELLLSLEHFLLINCMIATKNSCFYYGIKGISFSLNIQRVVMKTKLNSSNMQLLLFVFLAWDPARWDSYLLFCHFKFRVKVCFLNAINADRGGFWGAEVFWRTISNEKR